MATADAPMNMESASARVKSLINTQLKQVCKGAGLPVSGAKAALQTRIISQLQLYANSGNFEAFNRLKALVSNPDLDFNGAASSSSSDRHYPSNPMQPQYQYSKPYGTGPSRPASMMSQATNGPRSPLFKSSPFYSTIEPLTPVLELKARETTRDTAQATINLRPDIAASLSEDRTMRAMVYCAAESISSPFSRVDIAFPNQVEIKVNQDEVKANLKGLKNKPGSTRPADITDFLRKRSGYSNELVVTYALTKSRYFLVVNLVKQYPVDALVAKLKAGKTITKERVLREMATKAEDNDIGATSTIMSLKCPLSTLRIDVPCRSTTCSHNQCFDATSFLQLQEQAPTWTCPVCNKGANFDFLLVDQYVDDILKSTSRSVDQVTIEPNGKWSTKSDLGSSPKSTRREASSDEDDLVEIQEAPRVASIKTENIGDPTMLRTPPISSREPSTSSGLQTSSSNKRPAGQVVDLTLSSDEDEEPIRAPKRHNALGISNGVTNASNLDRMPIRPNGLLTMAPRQSHLSNPFPETNHYPPPGYT